MNVSETIFREITLWHNEEKEEVEVENQEKLEDKQINVATDKSDEIKKVRTESVKEVGAKKKVMRMMRGWWEDDDDEDDKEEIKKRR